MRAAKANCIIRRDRTIGFDLHGQLVIVQNLTFTGRLYVIRHFLDRRIDRIDRDQADRCIFRLVALCGHIAFASVDGQFHEQIRAVVEVADYVVTVQDFDARAIRDIASSYNTRTFRADRKTLGAFDFHTQADAFEVQDHDIGHVFAYTSDRGKLVQDVVDLYAGDGRTLKGRHQNATQGVAHGQTETTLKRFGDNGCLTCRVVARLHFKLGRFNQFLPILVDHAMPPFLSDPHVQ